MQKNCSRKKSTLRYLWSLAILLPLLLSIFSPRFASGDTAVSTITASTAICEPSIATEYQASYNEVSLYAGICNPSAAIFDSRGNLWVADRLGRVLEFPPPLVNGENATLVIGQANFTSLSQNTDASTIKDAEGLAFDSSGDLWVSDVSNHRVLGFRAPLTSGMAATVVLGQPDFTTESPTSNPTASSFSTPAGLAFDSSGNLWVADSGYSRVLEFKPPFSTGQSAHRLGCSKPLSWSTNTNQKILCQ
jgi:sugar lactone lactonase YvrE